jgi:hypothetical protein
MSLVIALASLVLIALVLIDAFEAVLSPRRVTRPYRPIRFFYATTWAAWRFIAMRIRAPRRRATFLSLFGPLSLLALFGTWVVGLIVGFAVLAWSLGATLQSTSHEQIGLGGYLYLSGVTFFTLGFGDLTPTGPYGRLLAVFEAGFGYAFLAAMLGYLPVLYQAYGRRELMISLLDARAGSPPSAGQFLLRMAQSHDVGVVDSFLAELERWAAELLESQLSFPMLGLYRSQHDNQSWLATLTTALDTCALLMSAIKDVNVYQAKLTFAMARHAAVDLGLVVNVRPQAPAHDRLDCERCAKLHQALAAAGLPLRDAPVVEQKLTELREMYEPFVNALSDRFLFPLPPFFAEQATVDNWQTSAWTRRTPGIDKLPLDDRDQHFA